MNQCVVCGEKNHEVVCRVCGFDKSCYYEAFPTLGKIPQGIPSVQAQKVVYNRDKSNLLCCEKCGQTTFELLVDKAILRCTNCGIGVSLGRVNTIANSCSNESDCLVPGHPRHYLSAGSVHTVILRRDGTVCVAGTRADLQEVQDWKDIVCVAAGDFFTAAVNASGTVHVSGSFYYKDDVSNWKNIAYICVRANNLVGLRNDGTAVSPKYDLSRWKNIIAVSAGYDIVFGLQQDGKIVYAGSSERWHCDFSKWQDIVDLSVGYYHIVGLKKDGTVVATGYNAHGQCDVTTWKNIVAISAGPLYTLGLRKDGTVISTMPSSKISTEKWRDIVAISAGPNHIVGLDQKGVFWAVGENKDGRCDVNKLTY